MTNSEELKNANNLSNELMKSESDISKAKTMLGDLIQVYNLVDIKEAGEKLKYEAPRVMAFLEIAFDYVINVDNNIRTIQGELEIQSKELRALCIANGDLESLPHEVA